MKMTGMLDRRIRGRLALMGTTQGDFCEQLSISYVGFRKWLTLSQLPETARKRLAEGVGVPLSWLDSESLENVGDGLDALCQRGSSDEFKQKVA